MHACIITVEDDADCATSANRLLHEVSMAVPASPSPLLWVKHLKRKRTGQNETRSALLQSISSSPRGKLVNETNLHDPGNREFNISNTGVHLAPNGCSTHTPIRKSSFTLLSSTPKSRYATDNKSRSSKRRRKLEIVENNCQEKGNEDCKGALTDEISKPDNILIPTKEQSKQQQNLFNYGISATESLHPCSAAALGCPRPFVCAMPFCNEGSLTPSEIPHHNGSPTDGTDISSSVLKEKLVTVALLLID